MTVPLLVCCGLATLDVVQRVERVPGPDEKVVARGTAVTFGGPAANAAATAAALGVPSVLVTALGSGAVASLVRDGLERAGVRVVDLAAGAPGDPPVSTVLVTEATGQRAVASTNATLRADDLGPAVRAALAGRPDPAHRRPGGAGPAGLAGPDGPARPHRHGAGPAAGVLDGATAVLVDGHHLAAGEALAAQAAGRGIVVLLDGGSWKPGLERLLAHTDVAVLSADFVVPGEVTGGLVGPGGDVLDAVAALGPSFVARSAGPGPVRVRLPSGGHDELPVPAVPPGEVVDTLGAGDVLHGATAAALARGAAPPAALREGIATASRSVRHEGALGWARALSAPGR